METDKLRKEFYEIGDALCKLTKDNADHLSYLEYRWADERKYEDFNDYIKIVKEMAEKAGFEFKSMTKTFKITLARKGAYTKTAFYAEIQVKANEIVCSVSPPCVDKPAGKGLKNE